VVFPRWKVLFLIFILQSVEIYFGLILIRVDKGETFFEGAIREGQEEAGVNLKPIGIYRIEHNSNWSELRITWAGEQIGDSPPKSKPDKESRGAKWVILNDLYQFPARDSDFYPAFTAVSQGVKWHSLEILKETRKELFSTSSAVDKYNMSLSLIIRSANKYLMIQEEQSWKLPLVFLSSGEHFFNVVSKMKNQIGTQIGQNILLDGILQIEFTPLSFKEDIGSFKVVYVGSLKEQFENQNFKLFTTEEMLQNNIEPHLLNYFTSLDNQSTIYPANIIVDSIYATWNFN